MNAVSETALITLKSRAVEAQQKKPVIKDDMAVECLRRLQLLLPADTRDRITDRELPTALTRHIALRARKYDGYTREFLAANPGGLVVSLGCGFDTRYWRVQEKPWRYVELDLPEVIEAKKQVLPEISAYTAIAASVLEEGWIQTVQSMQKERVMFIAEGLFMYLPPDGVRSIFKRLSRAFSKSQIVFEVANEQYTRGIWKRMVESKLRRSAGAAAGLSYSFGVRSARDIEAYGDNIMVVEEWSYFEDKDIKPKILWLFRNFKPLTSTQWTIKATIG